MARVCSRSRSRASEVSSSRSSRTPSTSGSLVTTLAPGTFTASRREVAPNGCAEMYLRALAAASLGVSAGRTRAASSSTWSRRSPSSSASNVAPVPRYTATKVIAPASTTITAIRNASLPRSCRAGGRTIPSQPDAVSL